MYISNTEYNLWVSLMQVYDDARFLGETADELEKIILTGDTKERWEKETPAFVDLMIKNMNITSEHVLLDFGTGIGRIAKELIEKTGCSIIGVDISRDMLRESFSYVSHNRYTAMTFETFEYLSNTGKLKFDAAFSIWVLQHCNFEPAYRAILNALPQGANLFIANMIRRCVPVSPSGWANDGINIRDRLRNEFKLKFDVTDELTQVLPEDHHGHIFCEFLEKV